MTTVNIPHGSFPTFDLMLLETLKEKAEFEEPSSQRRDTSDLAGQPVAISLVGKVVVKELFVGVGVYSRCLSVCWIRLVRGSLFLLVVVVRRGMMKLNKIRMKILGNSRAKQSRSEPCILWPCMGGRLGRATEPALKELSRKQKIQGKTRDFI